MKYKQNNNIVYNCKYLVVWCSKYRRKILINNIQVRLKELVEEQCIKYNSELIEIEIMPDHVHLLVEIDPQFGIHKLIKRIKGYSSFVLRKEFKELTTKIPTLWTNSYLVSTVGYVPLNIIKEYIENQKTSQRK